MIVEVLPGDWGLSRMLSKEVYGGGVGAHGEVGGLVSGVHMQKKEEEEKMMGLVRI